MAHNEFDDDRDATPPPILPAAEIAKEAWRVSHRNEGTLAQWRQFFFGSKETGSSGWTKQMEDDVRALKVDVANQKFLSWKIMAASAMGGALVTLAINLIKLFK